MIVNGLAVAKLQKDAQENSLITKVNSGLTSAVNSTTKVIFF